MGFNFNIKGGQVNIAKGNETINASMSVKTCSKCNGRGIKRGETCSECKGAGQITKRS